MTDELRVEQRGAEIARSDCRTCGGRGLADELERLYREWRDTGDAAAVADMRRAAFGEFVYLNIGPILTALRAPAPPGKSADHAAGRREGIEEAARVADEIGVHDVCDSFVGDQIRALAREAGEQKRHD